MMKGIGVSPFVGIGRAYIFEELDINIDEYVPKDKEAEIKYFEECIAICKQQMKSVYQKTLRDMSEVEAKIFEAHMMIIEDEVLLSEVKNKIYNEEKNAATALKETADMYIQLFKEINDEYIKERAADIKDITNRLLRIITGSEIADLTCIQPNTVIFANDLSPSVMAQIKRENIVGIVTEIGGETSHTAIIDRTMEVAAIVGVKDILTRIKNGDEVIVDGTSGEVILNPSETMKNNFSNKMEKDKKFREELCEMIGLESVTKDGHHVEITCNIGNARDAKAGLAYDAEGVGLFRSEFLYMGKNTMPTEEEQFSTYKQVLEMMEDKPTTIRTLDIGGDKELSYINIPAELNPFLGYRAIRISLDQPEIFKVQLRALLRASIYGNLRIMFPMISSIEEFRSAKTIYEVCKYELISEGVKVSNDILLGIMIEVPSAAVLADLFAKEVDFFSIGTNDLIQYMTATDRMNTKIAALYNQYHPAVLRIIYSVIKAAHAEGKWICMCGEMAQEPKLIPVLIGMGLDELSMSSQAILNSRKIIRSLSKKEMEAIANTVINFATAKEVEAYLNKL